MQLLLVIYFHQITLVLATMQFILPSLFKIFNPLKKNSVDQLDCFTYHHIIFCVAIKLVIEQTLEAYAVILLW